MLQTSREGRCDGASVGRRKTHRRQRTRPASVAAASASAAGGTAADRGMAMAGGTEVGLLHHHQSDLFVNELDTSLGSPYRRRPATAAAGPPITQVYT